MNYLSFPKLQRFHRWSFGMDKLFHPTLNNGCNYLSMLGLKLNHDRKRGPWDPKLRILSKTYAQDLYCEFRWVLTIYPFTWGTWANEWHLYSWWRNQMKTFSALLAICAGNSPVTGEHKGQWRGALMFSVICAWINGWVNNREAGDLRRHRTHYDDIVMVTTVKSTTKLWGIVYETYCTGSTCCQGEIKIYGIMVKENIEYAAE